MNDKSHRIFLNLEFKFCDGFFVILTASYQLLLEDTPQGNRQINNSKE
jgi:hypothetical protein